MKAKVYRFPLTEQQEWEVGQLGKKCRCRLVGERRYEYRTKVTGEGVMVQRLVCVRCGEWVPVVRDE